MQIVGSPECLAAITQQVMTSRWGSIDAPSFIGASARSKVIFNGLSASDFRRSRRIAQGHSCAKSITGGE
jgi:hypothetical protein